MKIKTKIAGALLAMTTTLLTTTSFATPGAWSKKPVRIVVTFPPGGTSDLVARLVAKHLDTDFGQKTVVDNRPGATGTVAASYVAKQKSDGTTLILANNAPFTIAPTRFKKLPYKPIKGFTHIAYIGASSPGLFVQPSSGIKTLKQYAAKVKNKPMTYGSSGVGSIAHILGEAVDSTMSVKSIHVPYKGSAPAIQDFRAGALDSFYDMVVQNSDMIKNGEAVAVAIASRKRNPQLPNVPTFKEQGYNVVIENWVGISAPAGVSPSTRAKIHETVLAVFKKPEVKKKLTKLGITHVAMTSKQYEKMVAKSIRVWAPLIKSTGIK